MKNSTYRNQLLIFLLGVVLFIWIMISLFNTPKETVKLPQTTIESQTLSFPIEEDDGIKPPPIDTTGDEYLPYLFDTLK